LTSAVFDGEDVDAVVAVLEQRLEHLLALGVVAGHVAEQRQGCVHLAASELECLDHALGVLPAVKARDLRDDGQVVRDAVVIQPILDLGGAEVAVLQRKRVDRRHDEGLWRSDVLRVLGQRHDDCVVLLDEAAQIGPDFRVGRRQVDVAAPHPWTGAAVMIDQRQRLRVVHHHEVVVHVHAQGVLEIDLLVDLLLQLGEVDLAALQRVVQLLGDVEEVGAALDQPPVGLDAKVAREQGGGGQHLRDAPAVEG